MKTSKIILGLMILIILSTASAALAQQQFIQRVTELNRSCNSTCSVIDLRELNGNPGAILFITPILISGRNPNPHPIGAYYVYQNKWGVLNMNGIEAGAFNTSTLGPFMIDEEAATYHVEFRVQKVSGILSSAETYAKSMQSSIIVISSDSTGHIF